MFELTKSEFSKETPQKNQYELTDREKEQIEAAINIIKKMRIRLDEEGIKDEIEAEQTIISYGHKCLPFLEKQLSDNSHHLYLYTRFAGALSKEDDLNLLLKNLKRKDVLTNTDGSSASSLSNSIARILREIRFKNPKDSRLKQAGQILLKMLDTPALNIKTASSNILKALIIAENSLAEEYIKNHPQYNFLNSYIANPQKIPIHPKNNFETWEERQQRVKKQQRYYIEHVYDDDYYYDHLDLSNNEEMPEDSEEYELTPEELSAIDSIDKLIQNSPDIEETAMPAIKLHMFNYLLAKPRSIEEEIKTEFKRIGRLSEIEKESARGINPLPTIGIEIEIPNDKRIQDRAQKILDELKIPNYWEPMEDNLLEVNPDFSYHALIQARIIQELANMGLIFLTKTDEKKYPHVPDIEMLSMHINFGIPTELKDKLSTYKNDLYLVNDLLTAAFTSQRRLQMRKTSTSMNYDKTAKKTKKHKKDEEPKEDYDYNIRLELRATEFKNYPSYRLLVEAQRIAAMLIAHIKNKESINLSDQEQNLVNLWDQFSKETQEYFNKIGLSPNMADTNKYELIEMISDKKLNLRERCRMIVGKYSRLVVDSLQLK